MANYAVTDWVSDIFASLAEAAAAIETKLETLDSTNNTIRHIDIVHFGSSAFQAVIIYDVTS